MIQGLEMWFSGGESLLCKHEELNSDAQRLREKPTNIPANDCNPSIAGRRVRQTDPWGMLAI